MKRLSIDDLAQIVELQQEVAQFRGPQIELMQEICSRILLLTGADGAVVGLREETEVVFRAQSGSLVDRPGDRLELACCFAGQAILGREVLHSPDAKNDSRLDLEVLKTPGVGSVICIPLAGHETTIGVLKVISKRTEHFNDREIGLLRLIAGVLESSIGQTEVRDLLTVSERKFRTLFENASDAILISKDGIGIEANAAFCDLYGYGPQEIRGLNALVLLPPEARPDALERITQAHDGIYEARAVKKSGEVVDVEAVGKTLFINGEPIRVTTSRDISAKKRTEAALRLSEQKAREAAQAKSLFLANMSHELRTPLNGVVGMTNLLLGTELTQDQREYALILNQSSENLITIVNDILDFTKLEERKLTIQPLPFKLRCLVSEVCGIFRISAEKKNLSIHQHYAEDLPLYLNGDPIRIKQIFLNLLNNAIKFTPHGSITVQASGRSGAVRFTITDTGPGIPEEFTHLLFTPFRQLDPSATREVGGTGLGLSICRELVTLMGGEIGFTPAPGGGASFWFELPLTEVIPPEKDLPQEIHAKVQRKQVLVVEDNAVNQLIAQRMLEKLGHSAKLAGTGHEALAALESGAFELVLMDCQMPLMDGFETTTRIRNSSAPWKNIPIVAMTAHAVAGDRERCLAVGMTDYLAKPIKLSDLAGLASLR